MLRPAPAPLKAQRRQGGRRLGAPGQNRLCRLKLPQRRPGLARLRSIEGWQQGRATRLACISQRQLTRPASEHSPQIACQPTASLPSSAQLAFRWKRTRCAWSGGSSAAAATGAHRSQAAWRSAATAGSEEPPGVPSAALAASAAPSSLSPLPLPLRRSRLAFCREEDRQRGLDGAAPRAPGVQTRAAATPRPPNAHPQRRGRLPQLLLVLAAGGGAGGGQGSCGRAAQLLQLLGRGGGPQGAAQGAQASQRVLHGCWGASVQ